MLRHFFPMHLKSCLVLFGVNQEAGNVDEVQTNGQKEWLLSFSLENERHARLIVISQIDQVSHSVDKSGDERGHDGLLNGATEYDSVENAE